MQLWGLHDNVDTFQLLRLLLPHRDSERRSYGLKEAAFVKLSIKALSIPKNSRTAQHLENWQLPGESGGGASSGNFAQVLVNTLGSRCAKTPRLSVAEVNGLLDELAAGDKDRAMGGLLRQLTAQELFWATRIVMRDLKLGLSEKAVLDVYHQDAWQVFVASSNIKTVAEKLIDPSKRYASSLYQLDHPIMPMLAQRVNKLDDLVRQVEEGRGKFLCETKLDGERIQIHYRRAGDGGAPTVRLFARSSIEFSQLYNPRLKEHVLRAVAPSVDEAIFDGELCGWHRRNLVFEPFGTLKAIAAGKTADGTPVDAELVLKYIAFDILMLNGKSYVAKGTDEMPLAERKRVLATALRNVKHHVEIMRGEEIKTEAQVHAAYRRAVDRNVEGLMFKDSTSPYAPATRGAPWQKLKPDYLEQGVEDLDLIMVGGWFSQSTNARQGQLSQWLCAVLDRSGAEVRAVSFCRVGTGMTFAQVRELNNWFRPHMTRVRPPWLDLPEKLPQVEVPELFVESLENSRVFTLKANEIVSSTMYAVGHTLRFPRIVEVRDPAAKPWFDSMTRAQLIDMLVAKEGQLTKAPTATITASEAPTKAKGRPQRVIQGLDGHSQASKAEHESALFRGLRICVINGATPAGADELRRLVVAHGGSLIATVTGEIHCAVVGQERSAKAAATVKAGKVDCVRPDWLRSCVAAAAVVPYRPADLIAMSPATRAVMRRCYDAFGDSYTEPATADSLKLVLQRAAADCKPMKRRRIAALEREYECELGGAPRSQLRAATIYVDIADDAFTDEARKLDVLIRMFGGKVVLELSKHCTHVVFVGPASDARRGDLVGACAAVCPNAEIRSSAFIWSL